MLSCLQRLPDMRPAGSLPHVPCGLQAHHVTHAPLPACLHPFAGARERRSEGTPLASSHATALDQDLDEVGHRGAQRRTLSGSWLMERV